MKKLIFSLLLVIISITAMAQGPKADYRWCHCPRGLMVSRMVTSS